MLKYVFCFLFALSGLTFPQGRIVINEFMASNKTTYKDPKYLEYSDWIELYNAGTSQVNLKGFSITDDLSDPLKWKIEMNLILMPGQFYIVWADDGDTLNHTSFGLSADCEQLGIFYPDGSPADTFTYYYQKTDVSFGRFPDGGSEWVYYYTPTPGKQNDTVITKEIISNPVFSIKSGFYAGPQVITITHPDPLVKVYYSIDGSDPDESSALYSNPINVNSNTVVRAAAYKPDCIPSKTVTNTYFINETTTLPVVSISTAPANLFDKKIGIYVEGTNGIMGYCAKAPRNWNQDWERPIHLEFFENDKSLGFEIDAGIKIGGGCTRLYPQKPLSIYARSIYGDSKINYKIFPDKKIKEFNNIALRNSGQDWYRTLLRDGMMQTIIKNQMDIELQAYRPGIVFINGVYWGIYDIREKHNEHYIEANHKIDKDSIDICSGYVDSRGQVEVNHGSGTHFVNMIKYMESHDLSNDQYYKYITTQMDIDEYINYYIAQIFYANGDWPGGNIKFWRPRRPDGKWRWIVFDLDMGMGSHSIGKYNSDNLHYATSTNSESYSNPPRATFQFRSLLKNAEFKNKFIRRFAYHLNTTFKKERMMYFIDSLKNEIAPEIPRHTQNLVVTSFNDTIKWVRSCSYDKGSWENNFEILYEFVEKRHDYVRSHIMNKFGLSGTAPLTIINEGPGGTVFFDNIELKPDTVTGLYFKGVPMLLTVSAREGFKFKGWKGMIESYSDTISVILADSSVLIAEFEKVQSGVDEQINQYTFALSQNYPNPFNPVTMISYEVPQSAPTTLKIFDLLGKEVSTLVNEITNAGPHTIEFNATQFPSGIYFYQLKSGSHISSKKMLLLK